MSLPGQEFLKKYEDYCRRVQDGKYLEQHFLDPRNSDPVKTRIQLEIDSRQCIEYLREITKMCNDVRTDNGLEAIT